ncbi:MAG TPA: hypothetical protein VFH85_03785 [Gammaproteobacteria bacterium]|nr:hypothetical protein [Gammaproteobacteria bacterium]
MNKSTIAYASVIVAAICLLSGCAGIPISTLWHFRSFGADDLLQVNPADVRAAVQLDNGADLGEPPDLTVELKLNGEAQRTFRARLEKLRTGAALGPGIGEEEPGKHWYLFALSADGVQSFRRLQQYLRKHIGPDGDFPDGKLALSINVQGLDLNSELRAQGTLFIKTRLRLDRNDGFYTLFDGNYAIESDSAAQK